jgi:hypothetical protein
MDSDANFVKEVSLPVLSMDYASANYLILQHNTACPYQWGTPHSLNTLWPVTYFQEQELNEAIQSMQDTLQRQTLQR